MKRFVSGIVALLLVFSLVLATPLSVQVTADEYTEGPYTYAVSYKKATITGYTGTDSDIVIPSSFGGYPVAYIGDNIFRDCSNLTSVTIPDGVTAIGHYAFRNCTSLTSVTIPDSVTRIGYWAFQNCTNLEYNLYDNAKYLGNADNPYVVLMDKCSTDITYCNIYQATKVIYCSAFCDCSSLTSITIPDSVTSIGISAFRNCTGMTSAIIGDSVTDIGNDAFSGCTSLTEITVSDSVSSIGTYVFRDCDIKKLIVAEGSDMAYSFPSVRSTLEEVIIPNSVTTIAGGAFEGCTNLTSITIPDSVTTIGYNAFYGCRSLTQVNIGNGVVTIEANAFAFCNELRFVTIPSSVTRIQGCAFLNSNIVTIILGSNISYIGENAFDNGDAFSRTSLLTDVWYSGDETQKKRIEIQDSGVTGAVWHYKTCDPNSHVYTDTSVQCTNCDWAKCGDYGLHIWDDRCDTICNKCEYTRTAPHRFTNACDATCNGCDATRTPSPHVYSDRCDPICNVCGVSMNRHTYSNNCDSNCNVCNAFRIAPHTYDNACDTTCNGCGLSRTTTHVYDGEDDLTCNICKQTLAPAAPTLESYTDTTVTLVAIPGYEYSYAYGIDLNPIWQTSNVFTGLSPASSHSFIQRVAESSENFASPASLPLSVTTDKSVSAAPEAPRLESITDSTVSLVAVIGYEYSMDGNIWQKSNVFAELEPATHYAFYQRVASTGINYSSPASPMLEVTTRARTGIVTYDANGGKDAPATQFKVEGMELILAEDIPTYTDHIFIGWATAPYKDVTYQPGSDYQKDADITLYAMWLPECSECNGKGKVIEKCPHCGGSGTRAESSKSSCCNAGVMAGLALGGDPTKTYCLMCRKPCNVNFTTGSCPTTVTSACEACKGNCYGSQKMENNCVPPVVVLESKTNYSVTLVGNPYLQYSTDGINWQDSPSFNNLEPATQYAFYQRYKETRTLQAGPASNALQVTTENSKPKPKAPVILSFTDEKVTLLPIDDGEYSIDGETWQRSNVFEGLSPVTKYTFYQRYAATDDLWCSPMSEGSSIVTDKSTQTAVPETPTVESFTSNSITLVAVEGCAYSKDGIKWQSSNVFTGLSCGTEYTFYQRYAQTDTAYAGKSSAGATFKTDKGTQSTPPAPSLSSKTYNSVTLWDYGYEYSRDGINWQTSSTFAGLLPETNYMFYQRKAETDTYYASEASEACRVRTEEAPACVADPTLHSYTNACDTSCDTCGAVRKITHDYTAATCIKAKTCKVCGVTSGKALGHTYSNACDTTCNRCNATRKITHNYAAATCTKAKTCTRCKATSGKALGHTYSNTCDKSCNRCKATRTITHTYSNSCDTSCNVCKAKRTIKHTYSNSCDTKCNVCSKTRKITHTYKTVTTKATLTKNGKTVKQCSVCGKVSSTKTIKYAKTIKLSTTSYTYNGKAKTPSVTVKDSAGKTLKKNTDYTVTYASGRKNVGTYEVTIKLKGNYSGTKVLTFNINPAKASVSKLTAGKDSIAVTLKKASQVTGYQIQYATSKSFSGAKTVTVAGGSTTKYTLKSLKSKKKYYVRVRAYKTVGSTKFYSAWSASKNIKTK